MAKPFRLPGVRLPDLLDGLSPQQRLRREREDAASVLGGEGSRVYADPEALKKIGNTFAGTEMDTSKLIPYAGQAPDFVICARLDLEHPLYFQDNRFAPCADCDCDLQYRPDVPAGPDKVCVCCAARRVREAGHV